MKNLLWLIRWLVGLLFIFSGLIKVNDPIGLSYKMQEFFEVWGLHGFNEFTLFLSIFLFPISTTTRRTSTHSATPTHVLLLT